MDLAIASDRLAGEAACEALDAGDVSRAGLFSYRDKLEGSFVRTWENPQPTIGISCRFG